MKEKENYELRSQTIWQNYDFSTVMDLLHDYWYDFREWEKLKSFVDSSQRILDVGCGVVSVLNVVKKEFPEVQCVGVDPLVDQYATLYPLDDTIQWRRGYLESLDFSDEEFSIVFCSNALDHVEDLDQAFSEIGRVLKPGGHLVLTLDVFAKEVERNEGHPYSFTPASFEAMVRNARYKPLFSTLVRRKLGMMPYVRARMDRGHTRTSVRRLGAKEVVYSWIKQILRRGALGEAILVAQKAS